MKKIFTVTALTIAALAAKAQDIHFSQFYENAMLRNPALTGIFSGDYKAGLNYRTQWGNISNPFQTVIASAESRIVLNEELHDYLSFGLCGSYDHAGSIDFNSTNFTAALNYNKSLNDGHASYLSVGFAGGYIQRSVDVGKMTLDEQYISGSYVATAANGEQMTFQSIHHYDVSAGVSFNSTAGSEGRVTYYIGAAAFHVTKPRESFNANEAFIRLSPKYTGSLGLTARIGNHYQLTVLGNYSNQNPYQETIFGGLLGWRGDIIAGKPVAVSAGCFYRLKDAVIPTLKLEYKTYTFTSSYDVTTSSLKPSLNSKGGYEFSFYVRGKIKRKEGAVDRVLCPKFEESLQSEFEQ